MSGKCPGELRGATVGGNGLGKLFGVIGWPLELCGERFGGIDWGFVWGNVLEELLGGSV